MPSDGSNIDPVSGKEQTTETSGTLPRTMISRLKDVDDISCLSIKSGRLGPYAGGADTPPVGQTEQSTEQPAEKSTTDKLKEKVGLGKSTEASTTEASTTE